MATTVGTRNSKRAEDGSKSVAKARAKGPSWESSPDAYISDTGGRMGWLVISWGAVSGLTTRTRANKWGAPSRESLTHQLRAKLSEWLPAPVRFFRKHASPHNYSHFGPHRALSSFIDVASRRNGEPPYRIPEPPSWPPATVSHEFEFPT